MAVLNLSVTVADEDVPRLIAAARDAFGNEALELPEITEMLRQYGISQMTQLVHNYERRAAIAAAETAAYTIGVS